MTEFGARCSKTSRSRRDTRRFDDCYARSIHSFSCDGRSLVTPKHSSDPPPSCIRTIATDDNPARVEEERQGTESWSKYAGLTRLIDTGEIATRSEEQRALSLSLYPQPTRRIIGLRGRRRGAGKFRQKNKQRVNPSIRPRRRYD